MPLPHGALALARRSVGEIRSVEVIEGGQHSTLRVRGDHEVIVKVFPVGHKGYGTERIALRRLARVDLVPRLLGEAEDADGAYVLLASLPGKSLAERLSEPTYQGQPALIDAASVLGRLHSILRSVGEADTNRFALDELAALATSGVFLLDEYRRRVQSAEAFLGVDRLAAVLRTLEEHRATFDRVCSRVQLVHGDYQPRNILVGDVHQVIAVLDWELARRASPICDIAMLLRFARSSSAEVELLRAYDGLPWSTDDTLLAARCYDAAKVTLGISKATGWSSDLPSWLDYIDGCLDCVACRGDERLRAAASKLLFFEK